MAAELRIGTVNGVLLACYFVPVWTAAALKIVVFPLRGMFERANIAPSLYFVDYFQLHALGTVRMAWLLALGKLAVVAFFALFAMLSLRASLRRDGGADEVIGLALVLGVIISLASMAMASAVNEPAALRLHATESLMLLGGLIVLAVDSAAYGVARKAQPSTATQQSPLASP